DEAAAGRREGQPGLAAAGGAHVGHFGLPQGHRIDDRPGIFVVDVDDDGLVRLLAAVGAVAEQHARAADRKLEALAAHGLDDHAKLKLPAAGDLEAVVVSGGGDADRDIALGLAHQAVADDAALDLVAVAPGIGAVVDREAHRQGRRVDLTGVDRRADGRVGDGVGNGRVDQPGDGDDVPGLGAL